MKKRIISAIVALIIVVPFIYFGGHAYAFAIGVLSIMALIEMLRLKSTENKFPFSACVLSMITVLLMVFESYITINITYYKDILIIMSLLFPTIFYTHTEYSTKDAFYLLGTSLFLGTSFNTFIRVRNEGLIIFFYLALIPVMTDTFAYFFGRAFGKHKLCPKVSPNKTWEGFIFGLIFGTIIPCTFYFLMTHSFSVTILFGTTIFSLIGQIGDLVFSKIKRENDIKDFSNIMPGHGGILDRLDSTIFVFMAYIFLRIIVF